MLQARLFRHDTVLVLGIAVARDAEGLNDVAADAFIPSDMRRRISIRPQARLGEGVGAARAPVEINIVGFDFVRYLRTSANGFTRKRQ